MAVCLIFKYGNDSAALHRLIRNSALLVIAFREKGRYEPGLELQIMEMDNIFRRVSNLKVDKKGSNLPVNPG